MTATIRINDPEAYVTTTEADLIAELLDLKGKRLLELGCGAAGMTRLLAERFDPVQIYPPHTDFRPLRHAPQSAQLCRKTLLYQS